LTKIHRFLKDILITIIENNVNYEGKRSQLSLPPAIISIKFLFSVNL
jgi:hypothetical protein